MIKRYIEIDFFRGLAIVSMVLYHINFNLFYFSRGYIPMEFLAKIIGGSFIFISGISLYIAYHRKKQFKYFFKRFLKLFIIALMITVVTKIFLKDGIIIFGIIHYFALSSLLIYPFLKIKKEYSLITCFLIIMIYYIIKNIDINSNYLFIFGVYNGFTYDYYPLIPWFSVMLIARYVAEILYPNGTRRFNIDMRGKIVELFSLLGKNSLKIYLIHQPIILAFLYLLGFRDFLKVLNI